MRVFRISEKNVNFVPNELTMVAIPNVIYEYLECNRRVTVPALGTFITKGSRDSVLFSEFLKSDDGVLASLLVEHGVDAEEVKVLIEEFVREVREVLDQGEAYEIAPMGRLIKSDGAILFECEKIEPKEIEPEVEISQDVEEQIVERIFESLSSFDEEPKQKEQSPSVTVPISAPQPKMQPKAKYDVWLIVALVAVLFAIFALLYGIIVEWQIGNISFGSAIDDVLYSIFG